MYTLLFCAALLGNADTQQVKAQPGFAPSAIPNKQFPLPTMPHPYCAAPTPGTALPTFYGTRDGGHCYNFTFDFDGDSDDDQVYVWAIGHISTDTYDNAVAYEVTDNTGVTLYRGTHYVGGDISNLQVGIVHVPNVGVSPYQLVVAYWQPGILDEIRVDWFSMLPTGLLFTKSDLIYTASTAHATAQHLSLDCSEATSFSLAWEDQGVGIKLIGFDALAGYGPVTPVPGSTSDARLPDVAMSQQVGGAAVKNVHLAYLESAGPNPSILKYDVDFAGLMAGLPTAFTLEDVEVLSIPFSPLWHNFQMDIDAPDHYTTAQSDWSYAYFNGDANKIKVRMCNRMLTPAFNTYVLNDGSIGTPPPVTYLPDITNAGNAFPTLTYLSSGAGVTVGWYTNYDPSGPAAPVPNNALYQYTANSQVYVSVVLDNLGDLRTPEYNRVDQNHLTNRPGGDGCFNYPKINFSKNNEGPKLFALFQSHNEVDIWPYAGGAPFLAKYAEWAAYSPTPLPNVNSDLYYIGSGYFPFPDISIFLSQKMVDWYPFSLPGPLFKKAGDNVISEEVKALSIAPNPFSDKDLFLINGGGTKERYTVRLSSADGKMLLHKEGTVAELNAALRQLQGQNLAAGMYFVNIAKGKENLQQFKIVKH